MQSTSKITTVSMPALRSDVVPVTHPTESITIGISHIFTIVTNFAVLMSVHT